MDAPVPTTKPCFLRQTMVTLADGKAYPFRALPINRETISIVSAVMDDKVPMFQKAEVLVRGIEKSLSYDNSPEEISYIMDNGLIPMTADAHAEGEEPVVRRVMNAMVAGLAKHEPKKP